MDFEGFEKKKKKEQQEPREPLDPLLQWGIFITGLWVLVFLFEAAFREEAEWLLGLIG